MQPDLYNPKGARFDIQVIESLALQDNSREVTVPVRVTFPAGAGPFPAIVFSHGAWAANYYYYPLAQYWAEHGYAVLQPSHADSVTRGTAWADTKVFSAEFVQDRVADDKFIIDRLNRLGVEGLDGAIDTDRVAIGGHSYGANTAMLMAGMTLYAPGSETGVAYGDERVKAALVISGQGLGGTTTKASFATIGVPMLVMTGSNDPGRRGENYAWRIEPFEYSNGPGKYLVFIDNADHGFGGAVDPAPGMTDHRVRNLLRDAGQLACVKATTLAFLDAHLRQLPEARRALATGHLDELTGGLCKVTEK